jgi:hypothetical protein
MSFVTMGNEPDWPSEVLAKFCWRRFVARLAGVKVNRSSLVHKRLVQRRLQQTGHKNCERWSAEFRHTFLASLCAGFYAAGERLQPGSLAEPNDLVALRPSADESEVFGTIGHVATR